MDYRKTAEIIAEFVFIFFPELLFGNKWHYANRFGDYNSLVSATLYHSKNKKRGNAIAEDWEYFFSTYKEKLGIYIPDGLPTFKAYDWKKRGKYLVVSSLPTVNLLPKITTIGILFSNTDEYDIMPDKNIFVHYFTAGYYDSETIFVIKEIDENNNEITHRFELGSDEYIDEDLLRFFIIKTKIKEND